MGTLLGALFTLLYSVNALQPPTGETYQPVYYTKESSPSSFSSSVVHDSSKPPSAIVSQQSSNPSNHPSYISHPSYLSHSQSSSHPSLHLSQSSPHSSSHLSQSPAYPSHLSYSSTHPSSQPSQLSSNPYISQYSTHPSSHLSHSSPQPYSHLSQSSSQLPQSSAHPSSDLSYFSAHPSSHSSSHPSSYNPSVSSYHVNQQFPTVNQQYPSAGLQEYNVQTSAQEPNTAQQNLYHQGISPYQQSIQYGVNQPFQVTNQQPYGNLYVPFNSYQNINSDLTKNIHIPSNILSQPTQNSPQVFPQQQEIHNKQHQQVGKNNQQSGQKVGSIKSTPLFHHQVYHPLHTTIQHDNKQIHPQSQQQRHRVPLQQKQRLSPPTPPRIYKNFHPMISNKPTAQVISSPKPQKETQREEEEKEEINEDESNEKLEEDDEEDHGNVRQENEEADDEEEHFRPEKFFSGNFRQEHDDHEDQEDQEDQRDHRDHKDQRDHRYRHEEADEDEEKYSESQPKSSSKQKIVDKHSYYKNKYFGKPFKADPDFESFRGFKEPKVEVKMYKYSKSGKPDRREYIEGKESENIPVVQHNKESYKSQWIVSTKTSSLSDE